MSETVLPPRDPSALEPLASFLDGHPEGARLVAPDDTVVEVPREVYEVLQDVAEAMRQGRAITVAPVSLRLTTTEAAEIIGVSRPTLIKLLDDGELPFEQPRRHRLLRLDDVLTYKESRRRNSLAQLDELTRQAVADGLYDASSATYQEALREARSGQADVHGPA